MSGETVVIDLANVQNENQLLRVLGAELKLGGPTGNHPVMAINAGEGWGMNWDALTDSFRYLGTGGIWGTSPKLKFPLTLRLVNTAQLKSHDFQAFEMLQDILLDIKEFYSREEQSFYYKLE